jgi:hypothetical protein
VFKTAGLFVLVSAELQQTVHACEVQRLCAALHVQTTEQAPQVNFHGVFADVQLGGNVAVAQTTIEHHDKLLLALGQFGLANGNNFFVTVLGSKQTLDG